MTHGYGWRRQALDHRDMRYRLVSVDSSRLPSSFIQENSRPILDQGQLGSCTAHGGERAINNLRLKAGLDVVDYSRLAIYYDTRALENSVASDAGAEIRDVVKTLTKKGAILESDWPYDISRFASPPPEAAYNSVEMAVAYQALDNANLNTLKWCLAISQNPIIFGFTVFQAFEDADGTGLVRMPMPSDEPLGGHCIVIEGYDNAVACQGGNRGAFWCANSWGTGWGKDGYCWLPYRYLCDPELATDFWHIELEQTISN